MTHRALKQCSNGLECPCNHRISRRATGDADEELAVPVTNELGPPGTFWRNHETIHLRCASCDPHWYSLTKNEKTCVWLRWKLWSPARLLDICTIGLIGFGGLGIMALLRQLPRARRGKRLRLQMTLHLHNRYHQSSPGRLKPSPSEPSKDQRAKSLYRWPPQPRAILRPVSKAQRFCNIPAGWFGNAVQYLLDFILYIIYTVNTWISNWAKNEFIYNQEINKT